MGLDLRSMRGKLVVSRMVTRNGKQMRTEYFEGDTLEEVDRFRVALGDRLTARVLQTIRSGLPIPEAPEAKPKKAAVKKKAAPKATKKKATKRKTEIR